MTSAVVVLGQNDDCYLPLESVAEAVGVFDSACHTRAIVHGNDYLGPDLLGSLNRLAGSHGVLAAHWQQGDVSLDAVHLRDEVGVASVVDAFISHRLSSRRSLGGLDGLTRKAYR